VQGFLRLDLCRQESLSLTREQERRRPVAGKEADPDPRFRSNGSAAARRRGANGRLRAAFDSYLGRRAARAPGASFFQRAWFHQIDRSELPATTHSVRFWDLAATEPSAASPDPDYTAGVRLDLDERTGSFYLSDLVRVRIPPGAVEQLVAATAKRDGKGVRIIIEQEPGAAGSTVIDRYKGHVLRGYNVRGVRATGAKAVRASVAAAAENGLITIVRGRNTNDFLDEICAFPHAAHDDCVDALAGAHQALSHTPRRVSFHVPRGNIYDIAEQAQRRTGSARLRLETTQHHRQHEHAAELAAAIGITLYEPAARQL
jgi:predicted phage terminase large subunit-like protein